VTLYTNFHTRELLTAEQMHADLLERDPGDRTPLDQFLSDLEKRGRVEHPYYEVTETDDPGDGRTRAPLCVMKENPIFLEEGETWDGTPVMWFETEWV
jgi:hypothetical protein